MREDGRPRDEAEPAGADDAKRTAETASLPADRVIRSWLEISAYLSPPETDGERDRLARFADRLMEETEGEPRHPLAGLLALVGDLLEAAGRDDGTANGGDKF